MSDDRWRQAHDEMTAQVQAHPDFHRLVRDVAVAEQPSGARAWLRRNSPTYGSWMTRGMPNIMPRAIKRARDRAHKVAADLNLMPTLPVDEGRAFVYVTARDHVRARLR